MKNHFSKLILCLFILLFIFTSCQTPKDSLFSSIEYTELDARNSELENIRDNFETEAQKSLWRSVLLLQTMESFPEDHKEDCKNLFQDACIAVLALLDKAIEEENLSLSKAIFTSLENLSKESITSENIFYADISQYQESVKKLETEFFQKYIARFQNSKEPLNAPHSIQNQDQNQDQNLLEDAEKGELLFGLSEQQLLTASRMPEYLKGLVTVWVDRGFSVQGGLGLPDRIIGSGFFIDSQGYLITNYHVIESEVDTKYKGYSRAYIKLYDDIETRYPARVIGYDKALDLALLKTEALVPFSFHLGSSKDLEVGDPIFAMGSPLGLENTITSGIVSSKTRSLSTIASVMQIDAAINPGNSGGPIIDNNGLVQAIVFAGVLEYEGLNFAIPIEQLEKVLPSLFYGEVKHSYTGFYAKTRREAGQTESSGLEVFYVMSGSSAQKGFLEVGDIILTLNGIPIRSVEDYQNALLAIPPQSIIRLTGTNTDGESFVKFLYTEQRPEMPLYEVYQRESIENFFLPIFGMKLKRVSTYNKNQFEIESIIKGSIADENSFSIQDPIEVKKIKILEKNTIIYAELFTRKRNQAYFEVNIAIGASMDSPYFF